MSGVIATMATTPKAPVTTSPPTPVHTPMDIGSKNVAVIGPEATPPESNAIAVKIGGTKNDNTIAIRYPGTRKYIIGRSATIRSMESPTDTATPMERLVLNAFAGIAPDVISYTCLFRTCTAGSAVTIK